jgi:hypothetical protein
MSEGTKLGCWAQLTSHARTMEVRSCKDGVRTDNRPTRLTPELNRTEFYD